MADALTYNPQSIRITVNDREVRPQFAAAPNAITARFSVSADSEPIRLGDIVSFNDRGEVIRGAQRPAGVVVSSVEGVAVNVVVSGDVSVVWSPATDEDLRRYRSQAVRRIWELRILADLTRERSRPAITADELRARLFSRPLPRRVLADGRLGPQAYATDDPLPLP